MCDATVLGNPAVRLSSVAVVDNNEAMDVLCPDTVPDKVLRSDATA